MPYMETCSNLQINESIRVLIINKPSGKSSLYEKTQNSQ